MARSKLVDLELNDEDKMDMAVPEIASKPDYPWGLRICLTDKELEKLGLEADCEIGDMIDIRCFATVTSVSKGDGGCRVELQIEKMAVENEMTENGEDDD